MPNKLTYDEVEEYIKSKNYTLLSSEYKNSTDKLTVECPNKHVYDVSYCKFKNGRRCPHCSNRIKITKNDVEKHLREENYSLLSEFKNSNNKILVRCSNGHEWNVTYQKFKKGLRCSKCSNKYIENRKPSIKWTTNSVKYELKKCNYELLNDYKNSKTKISVRCDNGHESFMFFNHILKGHRCFECSKVSRINSIKLKSANEFNELVMEKGYLLLDEYTSSKDNLLMICKNGHYTKRSPSNFKKGNDCKGCMMSTYEVSIYNLLKSKYNYILHEYVHPNLKSKRFDFAIMDSTFENIKLLIEVDGEHHFIKNSFGDTNYLTTTIRRDIEKNEFCELFNLPLLRIPYYKVTDEEWVLEQLIVIKKGE